MTFDEWFTEQYPNADLSESSVVAVKDKMHGAWCAALEWGTRPTTHNSKSMPCKNPVHNIQVEADGRCHWCESKVKQ